MTFSRIYELAGVRRLPVDPVDAARALGVKVVSYKAAAEFFDISLSELYSRCPLGFSFKEGGHYCIALNGNACGEQRRRFTAAHELAHCILKHPDNGAPTKQQEREAEKFAAELLAPLVVLHDCGVVSAWETARICGISIQAAEIRLSELAERERHGFSLTEDERRVAEIFRAFTESFSIPSKAIYRKNLYISIH